MGKIIFFILFFAFCSCSTTYIKSQNKIPVTFENKAEHPKDVKVSVTKEFFLWGLIPSHHEIDVDEQLGNKGYESVSDLVVTQKNQRSDVIWTLVTFGMYYPQSYEIQGKTSIR